MSQRYRIKRQISRAMATGALVAMCQPAFGAGFQILEQNVTNLGTAYAGTAALAADASTGFYNPAGLTRLCKEQIAGSLIWVQGSPKLNVDSARATNGPSIIATLRPGSDKATAYALIPSLHYSAPIYDGWTFGFNIASPFGLRNNYSNNSPARYMATRSELRAVDFSPSLAFKFSDNFSIGAGVDALYSSAKLDQQFNTGIAIPNTDGFIENSADGLGWGYHVGLMWEIADCTRLGVNYRSRINTHLKGDAVFGDPNGPGLDIIRERVTASVTFPETVTLSGFHAFSDCWSVMADVQWTHWKRFKTLQLRYNSGANSDVQTTPEFFKDTYRVALGGAYRATECSTLRFGMAVDRTPVQNKYRTVRIPDSNRVWLALGAQYRLNECMAVELGYAHLFFKKAIIDESAPIASVRNYQGNQALKGNNSMSANIVGIQLTWTLG